MRFFITDFFSKCDRIRSFLRVWSHLLKKSLMENFIFCAVKTETLLIYWQCILDFLNDISASLISNLHFELTQLCVWEVCLLFFWPTQFESSALSLIHQLAILTQNVKCCYNFYKNFCKHNLWCFARFVTICTI